MSSSSCIPMEQENHGMFNLHHTCNNIRCCICNDYFPPNAANMCRKCLRAQEDITLGLFRKVTLMHCPECKSYFQPPNNWIKLQFESKELLSFCLKKLEKNMRSKNVRLVNAEIVPTEPNSKRIKVRVYVQKEILNGVIVEKSYVVEYVQHSRMCGNCTKVVANPDQWVSVVQLRQHVSHMRTFLHLEQVIVKHGVASDAVRIKKMSDGIDFFFNKESYAKKFLDFIKGQVPVRVCDSKQLVSHDTKSNDYNYRYTFSVEICPVCREDLVVLPPKVALSLGNLGPIVICTKVTNVVSLFDPITSTRCCLDGDMYWRTPFKSLLTSKELVEYFVFDVEEVYSEVTIDGKKFGLANAEVARVKDLGKNDTRFNIKTHLGYLLKSGDRALGYDLCGVNCSVDEIDLDEYLGGDAILIRKMYEEKCQKRCRKPKPYLKDLEEMPDMMIGLSLGGDDPFPDQLNEQMGGLYLNDEKYEAKRRR